MCVNSHVSSKNIISFGLFVVFYCQDQPDQYQVSDELTHLNQMLGVSLMHLCVSVCVLDLRPHAHTSSQLDIYLPKQK